MMSSKNVKPNDVYLLPEEQEVFHYNIDKVLKESKISKRELGRMIGMNSVTLGNKLNGHNILRKYEAVAIMQALNIDNDEAFKKIPEELKPQTIVVETDTLKEVKDDLSIKTLALKENLIDLANRLCKKEELTVQEIGALTGLVSVINEM